MEDYSAGILICDHTASLSRGQRLLVSMNTCEHWMTIRAWCRHASAVPRGCPRGRSAPAMQPPTPDSRPAQRLEDCAHVYEELSDEEIDAIDTIAKTRAILTRDVPKL